ncbi:MAG: two-component system, NtrC family, sensor histidine kinase PilS [Acidobacteriota bacterium]|jgi:two-component system sensor histidine kinase PilS (NtrC family)|nr:two-component system, NtrC family, sensor histidine kinase PilS [Acidobacteriota bacterium]
MPSDARMLTAVRVVVVTTLLMASLIIQYTSREVLPINYLYLTAGLTYGLTLFYIAVGRVIRSRKFHLAIQISGDLIVETLLVYFTGGLDSPFSFLYLVSIITASMLLYRRGGLLAASGAVMLYGALADLLYYGVIPLPDQIWFVPTPWTSSRLYLNIATNFAGYYATALLTSYLSEKLQRTSQELVANRQNLAELRALNQNVVDSIPSGLITLSPGGAATFINPAGMQILQLDAHNVLGRDVAELGFFSPEQWAHALSRLSSEAVIRRESDVMILGEPRALGFAITPLKTIDGKASGYTLIFQDLTEMKKLEAELRLKDRMAAVGELSAGIAHEIRNPLAAIAGSAQVLKKSEALTPQEQRLMSIIMRESERLNKSIADFLRFVKPQEKRALDFDVAASLSETLDLLTNSAELTPHHTIERDIDPSSFTILGDADQIRQVFWNLARNAMQAMPNGGALKVTTEVSDDAYRILFTDNGRGMSPADLQRLFQPFRTNFPSGTGLGMAISYRILQEHGGGIVVASREGEGTTITISLPVRGAATMPADVRRTDSLPAAG